MNPQKVFVPDVVAVILSEAKGMRSRREATVTALANADIAPGTVMGRITDGTTAAFSIDPSSTGNGVPGTITVGAAAMAGRYTIRMTSAGATAAFVVENPKGVGIGQGAVGSAFSEMGLAFTLADGSNDYAINDLAYIDVAEGSGKWKVYNPANTDGSEVAAGVLYRRVRADADTGDVKTVVFDRDFEVKRFLLIGLDVGGEKQLAERGIIVRGKYAS